MDTNQRKHHDNIVSDPFTITLIRIKARQLCRRADFSWSDYDDLLQDMHLYLLEKAHLFDPIRGSLQAFVTRALCTWVAMLLRYRNREKRCESYRLTSLDRVRVESNGNLTALGFVLIENDGRRLSQIYSMPADEHLELREAMEHVMGSLTSQEQEVLAHVAEHSVASAVRTLGMSRRQINHLMARTRDYFEKAGLNPN